MINFSPESLSSSVNSFAEFASFSCVILMAIISGFQSTTVWRAFILNAMATSVAICVAILIKMRYDTFTDQYGNNIQMSTSLKSIVLTFIITFLATFTAYTILYILFGYGRGMLAE